MTVTYIPTPHNFYQRITTAVKHIRQQGNTSRLLIIGLIIWNIALTINGFNPQSPVPQFTDKQMEAICIEEEIPDIDIELTYDMEDFR